MTNSLQQRVRDAVLIAHIALVASIVPLMVRMPLDRLGRMLEPSRSSTLDDSGLADRKLRIVETVLARLAPVIGTGCLTRGITRYYFLRRAGLQIALAFGISQPDPRATTGHCWLEMDGEPFLERRDPRSMFIEVFRIAPC